MGSVPRRLFVARVLLFFREENVVRGAARVPAAAPSTCAAAPFSRVTKCYVVARTGPGRRSRRRGRLNDDTTAETVDGREAVRGGL